MLTLERSLSSTTAFSPMFQIRSWSPHVANRSGRVAVLAIMQQHSIAWHSTQRAQSRQDAAAAPAETFFAH